MNSMTSQINQLINITPMSLEEAKECDEAINIHLDTADFHLDSAGALLLNMKRREGWKALKFSTWTEYLESRASGGKSRRRALELLQAEEVKENLTMCGIPHMHIPTVTSQLTALAQLSSDQQPVGLHKADELAQSEGKKRTANHIAKAVKEIKSIAAETAALGKSLGMPTQGDSVLPQSDRVDDLTHLSPADVDDRPGAPPTQLQPGSHNYTVGSRITTDYSLKGEVGKIVRVMGTSALVDWGTHRIEIPLERLRSAPVKQPNVPPHSYDGKDESESDEKLQSQPNLASSDAFAPTPAQWRAAQVKHVELLQALRDAQVENEQLSAENLKLRKTNGDLLLEIVHLQTQAADGSSCLSHLDHPASPNATRRLLTLMRASES